MVSEDFSIFPWGRNIEDDPKTCGVLFRENFLLPALKKCDRVIVDFSNTIGVGSSWLDEVFGELVFANGWSVEEFNKKIEIISIEIPSTKLVAFECIKDGVRRRAARKSRGTV